MIKKILRKIISRKISQRILSPNSKFDFLMRLESQSKILDVGCGNSQAIAMKSVLPNCHYTGIDIDDYLNTEESKNLMDEFIITSPEIFDQSILNLKGKFDAIICAHNIEHVNNRTLVLKAMAEKLKLNGNMYLSFPCKNSINFPKRSGSLNYYDDPTHVGLPPDPDEIIEILQKKGCKNTFLSRRYSPIFMSFRGLINEPISFLKKRKMPGTWELYGFETIMHFKKNID